ncbi:leucine-rich repeat-containing protein 59-like [Euwallacea fornicatus]|uniref:leucine-rich repeat-containing protein 59-like n=1 Tax=Euwallacea fornicatus TaxID=995702 RepID=UPI00338FAFDF
MVQKTKINVKERFYDGQIDLSMSDLDEVPVREIASVKNTHSLDLSNNRLTSLPSTFITLTFLTKLDLSKNALTELPEDFGNLSKLKYLDLYNNRLEHLPLSFGQLTALRFLDLKDNPLVPAIAKVAGLCIDTKGCQQCARDVTQFYMRLRQEVNAEVEMRNKERQKQLEINQKKKQEKKKLKKEKLVRVFKEPVLIGADVGVHKGIPKQKKATSKKDKKSQSNQHPSFFWSFLCLFLVCSVTLWFLFALKFPPLSKLGPHINNFYHRNIIDLLPSDYGKYGLYFEDLVWQFQVRTRDVTLNLFETVSKSDIYRAVEQKVREVISESKN